jgi:selenocysteine lyase/cysteine desulfurase
VPCVDGQERPYVDLDLAASTPALPGVADAVTSFIPWYASVHRGAGFKSRVATAAYESARAAALAFSGTPRPDHVAVLCRNTTEAINHLAFRLELDPQDVVLTTVVEHHANLLPWGRVARRRYVECDAAGTFDLDAVITGLEQRPHPALLAITGASNVTGWLPPIEEIVEAAHARGVPVFLDAAQLAPHRPLPANVDYLAYSGHKLYAPFGTGALIAPRATFTTGEPFLAGGGAVDLVGLDEVIWTAPPEREEAGSPNVIGAVALEAALCTLTALGWEAIAWHEAVLATRLRTGLAAIDGVRLLGPDPAGDTETLAVATFVIPGAHHALVAARLSAEWGIGVRHGCFCAHPYLIRLLGLGAEEVAAFRGAVMRGDHSATPGAVRASAGLGTTLEEVDTFLEAVAQIAAQHGAGSPPPLDYRQDPATGDFWPVSEQAGWASHERPSGAACGPT